MYWYMEKGYKITTVSYTHLHHGFSHAHVHKKPSGGMVDDVLDAKLLIGVGVELFTLHRHAA